MAVERKTLEEFVSTGIRSRKRFTRELRRLSEYAAACVVMEADLRDILGGRYRSGAHPNAVLGALLSIVVDFGVPVFFCSDRQAACRFVQGFLHRYHGTREKKKGRAGHHPPPRLLRRSGACPCWAACGSCDDNLRIRIKAFDIGVNTICIFLRNGKKSLPEPSLRCSFVPDLGIANTNVHQEDS